MFMQMQDAVATPITTPFIDEQQLTLRGLRQRLHATLIDSMHEEEGFTLDNIDWLSRHLDKLLQQIMVHDSASVTPQQQQQLISEVCDELAGFGPIASLMVEPGITDILINGPHNIWVEKHGRLQRTNKQFDDQAHLRRFLERIIGAQGRQLDARHPIVDAKLQDGSRLHALISPLCALGAVVSIRRFYNEQLDANSLISTGFISQQMLDLLNIAVSAGVNVMISGSAGAGKTTLLNVISAAISEHERVITVEETAELNLKHPHVVPLETRGKNSEGQGGITLRDLVKTALRMRADRIVVGEVRGGEVLDMLQAMNCGHDGSLTTLHANSPEDVINRLETLAQMADDKLCRETVQHMIFASVQLIVQVARLKDGRRAVVSISELQMRDGEHKVTELFAFKRAQQDSIPGVHYATGAQSNLATQIAQRGYDAKRYEALVTGDHAC
jgi:pilus assembly protein CpaF